MIADAKAGGAQRWVEFLSTLINGAVDGTRAEIPTEVLRDGQEIDVGGLTLRVYLWSTRIPGPMR